MPWALTETNPFNSDDVTTEGNTHIMFGSTLDANMGFPDSYKISSSGSGVGVPSTFNYRVGREDH